MHIVFSSLRHRKDVQDEGSKQLLKEDTEWTLSPEMGEDAWSSRHHMESERSMPHRTKQFIAIVSDPL